MSDDDDIMKSKFMKSELPPIYKRNNQEAYLDPIRQKLIFVTPEETVRQHVISYLINKLKVPKMLIRVEEPLKHYGIKSRGRADIIIDKYNEEENMYYPVAVIECKAPGILLGDSAHNQMYDYADKLGCDYCMLTDGDDNICYKYDSGDDKYIPINELPTYIDMLDGEYTPAPDEEQVPRIKFKYLAENVDYYIDEEIIGKDTPKSLAINMVNFYECLIYTGHKLPIKKYKIFRLIEDYGVRNVFYGNAGGGGFSGRYRSFIIEYNGSTEFVSLGMFLYYTFSRPDIKKTSINVAIDNEDNSHDSLELVIDDNVEIYRNQLDFYHHGRIAIGNIGSGKISELREFVRRKYPQIIDGDRFYLGSLTNNKLWNLDDPEVINLVENLISYALIRDEYREYIKKHRK